MSVTTNPYFTQGTSSEQNLVEDLIIESLRIYGKELLYIPRKLASKDEILGEDRLSTFEHAYPIEMYFENVDSFAGQGAFIQKFGLMMEQSATLVIARKRWKSLIGRYGNTIIPTRPNEGDLIYFPLTKGLFEIKFVQHQDPFYQLGKLYVYKLQVELFQYASERIDTGVEEIDKFETLKTFSTNTTRAGYSRVTSVNIINPGSGYTTAPLVEFTSTSGSGAMAYAYLGTGADANKVKSIVVTSGGSGYLEPPTVNIIGNGTGAVVEAVIQSDIDKVESFGDNNKFKQEANDVLFSETNPFGEIVYDKTFSKIQVSDASSTNISVDSTQLTTDRVN